MELDVLPQDIFADLPLLRFVYVPETHRQSDPRTAMNAQPTHKCPLSCSGLNNNKLNALPAGIFANNPQLHSMYARRPPSGHTKIHQSLNQFTLVVV